MLLGPLLPWVPSCRGSPSLAKLLHRALTLAHTESPLAGTGVPALGS